MPKAYFLSILNLPGPTRKITIKITRNNNAFSLSPKGSALWWITAATNMVIAAGMAANLVLKPIMIKIGQTNSPITARKREGEAPMPIGSGNSKFPEIRRLNFPQPWVIKKIDGNMRRIAKPISVLRDLAIVYKIGYALKLHFF